MAVALRSRVLPRRRLVRAVAATALVALATAVPASGAVVPSVDGVGDAAGQLDLTEVLLEQRDVRMLLRMRTSGRWTAADVARGRGRALCVTLSHGSPMIARGRVCLTRRDARPALSYTRIARNGRAGVTRGLAGPVARPQPGMFQATFLPAAVELPVGRFAWSADSSWTDAAACASACLDRLPDAGQIGGQTALLGAPRCFGAAARDPRGRCENALLRLAVEPSPPRAAATIDSFCDRREHPQLLSVCAFGAPERSATGTFALIGDSHAASLKTALHVVSHAKRWRGLSIVRAACPATQAARPLLPDRARSRACVRWNDQLLAWLRRHREIDTVVMAAHTTARVASADGMTMRETAQRGYRDEIEALLRVVPRVVVVRDTPSSRAGHLACIERALRGRRSPGPACAQSRGRALKHDPLAQAAREVASARVTVIDLTPHVCSARRCFPVVGGALVHRDKSHLTPSFSGSLGPFILRALER